MTGYFSERESGQKPRVIQDVDERVWRGIFVLVDNRVQDESFGFKFPRKCPDGVGLCGCDNENFKYTLEAHLSSISWPLSPDSMPDLSTILDLLEFCASVVGKPNSFYYHKFFSHHHLTWDRDAGLSEYISDVNRIFSSNGLAFEMTAGGQIRRMLPSHFDTALRGAQFYTGDAETDQLLEMARAEIMLPKSANRQIALEKLWDAFERIKTLETGKDKKTQTKVLLDKVAPVNSALRKMIESESMQLTEIGNTLNIRHSETTQEKMERQHDVDYVFLRMFSFLHYVLRATNRAN